MKIIGRWASTNETTPPLNPINNECHARTEVGRYNETTIKHMLRVMMEEKNGEILSTWVHK